MCYGHIDRQKSNNLQHGHQTIKLSSINGSAPAYNKAFAQFEYNNTVHHFGVLKQKSMIEKCKFRTFEISALSTRQPGAQARMQNFWHAWTHHDAINVPHTATTSLEWR